MIKVLELFAGIGACSKALERLGIEHEIVDAVEIDKYAIKSFNAIHGTEFEVQDITKWDKDVEVDLIMHGSPCQDFSVAGKQAGGDIGSGTRSSLMYETIRIVGKLRPKYVVWENVKNLLSKKHKHNFDAYIETMNILGYNSYYQVLNAKDYGIPQNRERVFTISIRKDIDKKYDFPKAEENKNKIDRMYGLYNQATRWGVYNEDGLAPTITASMGMGGGHIPMIEDRGFTFPEKEPLKLRLKDMLEEQVDEKYYLSDAQINKIQTSDFMQEKKRIQEKDYSDTILARDWKDPKCVRIGNIYGEDKGTGYAGNVWDKEELSPTLTNMQGGNRQPMILEDSKCIQVGNLKSSYEQSGRIYDIDGLSPTIMSNSHIGGYTAHKILVKNATKKGYDEAIDGDSINLSYPDSTTRRGRVGHGVAQTLQCNDSMGVVEKQRKDIKEIEKYCEYCGKQLQRKRFNGRLEDFTVFSNRKYCNRECMKRAYLKIGEYSQNWSNAHTTARKINELILHKEVCELCGSDTNLDIHHIDGNWQNNNLENLMCLCRSCHTKYEKNKNNVDTGFRIRKLTPRETWRLMRI
jgi:DNA-cytosine methyltransferase